MRRSLLCLLGLILAAPANAAQALDTYCNARYGYCVGYPASLRPQGESDAGDGQVFLGAGGQTELRAWGNWQLGGADTLTARYRAAQAGRRVTYAALHARWFVVSGTEAGRIFYQKTVYDPQAGRFATLLLRYPGQNTAVAAQVAPLARSLRFGP